MIKLTEHDSIITAFAEAAHGPGLANQPIWVVVRNRLDGSIRIECIQPSEASAEVLNLYKVSAASHEAMTSAVKAHLAKRKKVA